MSFVEVNFNFKNFELNSYFTLKCKGFFKFSSETEIICLKEVFELTRFDSIYFKWATYPSRRRDMEEERSLLLGRPRRSWRDDREPDT